MLELFATYIMNKNSELVRGDNFFVGYVPDLTASTTNSNKVIVTLSPVSENYDQWSREQTHAGYTFSLRFVGHSYHDTHVYAMSLCDTLRNIHGAQIDGDDCVYHCGNIAVNGPVYLTIDAKNRFVFSANPRFYAQRIDDVGNEEGT